MIDGLRIEDRNGVIVLCAPMENPFTGDEFSIPLLAFSDIEALRNHIAMLQTFIDKHSTPIPECMEDAFKEE